MSVALCLAWTGSEGIAAEPVGVPPDRIVTLRFVGDVSFAGRRTPAPPSDVAGADNPMTGFSRLLGDADLSLANMEGLLTTAPTDRYGEKRLNIDADARWAASFPAAGIDVVGVANNHSWDGDAASLLATRQSLVDAGVEVIGAGETEAEARAPFVMTTASGCVAILPATLKSNRRAKPGAFAATYRQRQRDQLVAAVRAQRQAGCVVGVYVHWGVEASRWPTRRDRAFAHELVLAGADFIVGHHPHVLQGVEFVCGAVIAYSLGNFVFTNREPAKRDTGVFEIEIDVGANQALFSSEAKAMPLQAASAGRRRCVHRRVQMSEANPRTLLANASLKPQPETALGLRRGARAAERSPVVAARLVPAVIAVRGFRPQPATAAQRKRIHAHLRRDSRRYRTRVEIHGERIRFRPPADIPSTPPKESPDGP